MSRKDREAYNEYMRQYILIRYHHRMSKAKKLLGGLCVKCGSDDRLELDHIDPDDKSFTMGKLWSVSWNRFLQELAKCQLLCYDCHESKTAKENSVKMTHERAVELGKLSWIKRRASSSKAEQVIFNH